MHSRNGDVGHADLALVASAQFDGLLLVSADEVKVLFLLSFIPFVEALEDNVWFGWFFDANHLYVLALVAN